MMATYFNGGSEIQADNLQTLYLMNRGGYATYSDAGHPSPGVLLLNSGAGGSSQPPNSLTQGTIHHTPANHLASHHHLVGIPLAGANSSTGDEISGHLGVPRFHYNLWSGADPSTSGAGHHIHTAIAVSGGGDLGSPMGFRQPGQGGLSLSLNNSSPHKPITTVLSPTSGTPTSASGVTNGLPGVILGSKFLKAAQELLDEVVNVDRGIHMAEGSKEKAKSAIVSAGEGSSGGGGQGGGTVSELTTAQRQELQMKKAKLLNMLDEVEQRYRQYHSQMQVLAASFEQTAGPGSAKSYTALALQTISKQFRCLKDAIAGKIKATGKSLGEDSDEDQGKSRLRMVDHQLRQQRALQQLGMMHHNAWRPQRGLPERAVSVLRAWLFEHFLHPYPKDSDKHMLAKQTGLTRSQVSNWFINARVRLWKPMVEEMYVEEMKSHDQQNPSDNATTTTTTTKDTNKDSTTTSKSMATLHSRQLNQNPQNHHLTVDNNNPNPTDLSNNNSSAGPTPTLHTQIGPLHGFSIIGSSESDPKRQRILTSDVMHNLNTSSPSSIMTSPMDHNNKDMKPGRDLFPSDLSGFGPYPVGDIGSRFNPDPNHLQYHHGNAVSLTLGLPHCDQSLSLAGAHHHHQNFLTRIGEAELCGIDTSQPPPHSGGGYDGGINDVQNRSSWRSTLI